jgi:hypothetical protein
MTNRYTLEVDNGVCITFSDYPFNSSGLKKAKGIINYLMSHSSLQLKSIKLYNPQEEIVFDARLKARSVSNS